MATASTELATTTPAVAAVEPAAAERKSTVMARPGPVSKPNATAESAVVASPRPVSTKPNATKSAVAGKSGAGKSAAV